MVVHRKDTARRKFKVEKSRNFSERSFLQKKIMKIVLIGVHKKDMEN